MTSKTAYAMPRIGDVIAAKYRLDKVAGEGGMGIVYAAEHLVLKQRVAVKVLLPDAASSEAVVERFAREARAAAKINSEHVARVLDAGSTAGGAPFLVMEYLEGCDLEELLALQKTLPIPEAADYLVQVLEGLAHAHAANIVHRDLKPANLFLACRPDGTNAIKLLDFGISKTTKIKPEDKRLTGHHVLGSPVYMSPEQLRNATDIDGRADLWSVGIVAYELLAGAPPFDGEGVGEIFAAILEKEADPLTEKNPKVPAELAAVISKCLRRDAEERWGDAAVLAREIAPFTSNPDQALAIVERAEQVLARAKMLKVQSTPLETRRVVAAIDGAVERARTSANKTLPHLALPLKKRKKESRNETLPDALHTRMALFAKRSPGRAVGMVAALVVMLGFAAFGAVRFTRSSSAASPAQTSQTSPAVSVANVSNAPPPADPPSGSETDQDDAKLLMDLPPNADKSSGGPRMSNTKSSGKPQRPKFLNTRE